MTDVRDRLARVVAAHRREDASEVEGSRASCEPIIGSGTGRESSQDRRGGGPRPEATSDPSERIAFTSSEQRFELRSLGLEIVGLTAPDPLTFAHLGLRGEAPERWEDIVFLDTETTGLSGGTGTYVFMLGTAWIAEGELVVRQHVLNDLAAERAFIASIHEELGAFRACASYNGKSFDLPILRTRVVLALRAELSVDDAHLDLLHPARRLWKDRFGSTTLRQLEASVLDEAREDDIAGALIPDRYFHYLRTRDDRLLEPVLRHNAQDVVSLVRITDRVARAVLEARSGRAPDHAPAALALARIFERSGEAEAAYCCYESAYVDSDLELRVRAALPFARALERRGEVARALRMVETLLELGVGSPRWREQAEARVRRLTRRTCTSKTSRRRRAA